MHVLILAYELTKYIEMITLLKKNVELIFIKLKI